MLEENCGEGVRGEGEEERVGSKEEVAEGRRRGGGGGRVGGRTEGKVVLTVGGEDGGTGREEEEEKNWCEGNSRGLKATSRQINSASGVETQ